MLCDPQLDAARGLKRSIENEFGGVVELVHDHVVARHEVQPLRDDVFTLGGREEQADFVGGRVHEPCELSPHGLARPEQLADFEWSRGLVVEELSARGDDGPWHRRNVRRVQVRTLGDNREIGAHAEWIGGLRCLGRSNGSRRGERSDPGDE